VMAQDSPRYARVTVWRNLQSQYTLTQWDWENEVNVNLEQVFK